MKRYITIIAALVLTVGVFAQKSEVTNAWGAFYNGYKKSKNPAELMKAKVHIDNATANADTKDDSKTWSYRGDIYLALYQKDFNEKMDAHKDVTDGGKRQSLAYAEAPTTNLVEATNSFLRAKTLDTKLVYSDIIMPGLANCNYYLQNIGLANYNQTKYGDAVPMFELAYQISSSQKKLDTGCVSNAALCSDNAKMWDHSIKNYKILADAGYKKGNTWAKMANVYLQQGDSVQYKATIAEGLKKYPNDQDLLVEDVNIKMKEGQDQAAIDQLTALVAQRPNDANLNLVVGNVYDRLANPKKADGTDADKPANYEMLLAKAVEYYKKAIELDPNNYDANYNLGVLYYNQSVYYYNMSQSTIKDAAKFGSMWEKPLPDAVRYLEAAHKLQPTALEPLMALKMTYGQMSDNDNYLRVKEEIKKLQGQ
jgi:tetratricopeptide (TPR) repeat protein